MNKRIQSVYEREFERIFLELRSSGFSEDAALDQADREASEVLDRYCDAKFRITKEGG